MLKIGGKNKYSLSVYYVPKALLFYNLISTPTFKVGYLLDERINLRFR